MQPSLVLEQECPQCGAPVQLDETDRILLCPYCRVKLFIHARIGCARYLVPNGSREHRRLVYAPYWRFRGMAFTMAGLRVQHRVLDTSAVALTAGRLPPSLALRPQALRMRYVDEATAGEFWPPNVTVRDFALRLNSAAGSITPDAGRRPQVFIGEVRSLVYTPLVVEDGRFLDGITLKSLPGLQPPELDDSAVPVHERPKFWPTLCPDCGWDMEGEKDNSVLFCRQCCQGWMDQNDQWQSIPLWRCGEGRNSADLWLPFWNFEADSDDLDVRTYADLIRFANLPRPVLPDMERDRLRYWVPAFKINPHLFLRLGSRMTVSRPSPAKIENDLPGGAIGTTSLPFEEALESIPVILAASASANRARFEQAAQARFAPGAFRLVLVPFDRQNHEFFQPDLGFSIPANTLKWGRAI